MVVFGLALIIGPFFVPQIQGPARLILASVGGVALLLGLLGMIITKLYVRTSANLVFVRTGLGGAKVVVDGGALVIPVVHSVIFVPTTTARIDVERVGADALLTQDSLRVKIKANFYIRVPMKEENIKAAASSLPDMTKGTEQVQKLIEEKLIGALRSVATQHSLADLNSDRQKFADSVKKIVDDEMASNGLSLESVNISDLDQEGLSNLRPEDNIFDAEGAKTIAKTVNAARVERVKAEQEAERHVKDLTVETAKYLAEKEREQASSVAEADANKRVAENEQQQLAEQKVITAQTETRKRQAALEADAAMVEAEQRQSAQTRQAEAEEKIGIAQAKRDQEINVSKAQADRAKRVAEIAAGQAAEVAERDKAVAVADAATKQAAAESKRLAAEKDRAVAEQAVQTATVTATAEREAAKATIAKQAEANQNRIKLNTDTDVAAYAITKQAEADKEAAQNKASAMITQADAEKQAKELQAAGEKALQLVPIEVANKQVDVNQRQVEVDIIRMRAQQENTAALTRDIALAMIEANKIAEVARAEAIGKALAEADLQIWGDPAALEKVRDSFTRGQSWATAVSGITSVLPPDFMQSIQSLVSGFTNKGASAAPATSQETVVESTESKVSTVETQVPASDKLEAPVPPKASTHKVEAQEERTE